jgi:hypothetical protein
MGFIVSQSVETYLGKTLDSFYVRIEVYGLNKKRGILNATANFYETQEAAASNSPLYLEDTSTPYGRVPTSMSYNGEWFDLPTLCSFHITESAIVPTTVYSSSFYYETVDYVDFDNDGNEIISQREEKIEVVTSESIDVLKSFITIASLTGSIYDTCYTKVKEVYSGIFGSENIIDQI